MKKVLLGALLLLMLFILPAQTLPEEQAALQTQDARPPVRYWRGGELGVQTLPGLQENPVVPLRSDPKLLVLLYHNIVFGRTGNVYNRDLYNFEHDLEFIKRNFLVTNFTYVLTQGKDADTDLLVITFDDGDLSLYAIVYPLFVQYGLEATIFLVPNFIGQVGYMSWEQVKEMNDYRTENGEKLFYFESHTLTHRMLKELSPEEVREELSRSKALIEAQTGEPVTVLALPFGNGAKDPTIISIAYDLGYQAIRTSIPEAQEVGKIDPWVIKAMNVENYSTDVMVDKSLKLLGR